MTTIGDVEYDELVRWDLVLFLGHALRKIVIRNLPESHNSCPYFSLFGNGLARSSSA